MYEVALKMRATVERTRQSITQSTFLVNNFQWWKGISWLYGALGITKKDKWTNFRFHPAVTLKKPDSTEKRLAWYQCSYHVLCICIRRSLALFLQDGNRTERVRDSVVLVVAIVLLPLLESRSVSRESRFVTSRQKERGNYYKQI